MAEASHPMMRIASTSSTELSHPTPDLLPFQAGQGKNVPRLEQSAEELSQGGSDIGEEIRKMQLEQRASESRRNSIASRDSRVMEAIVTRSRNASTSSYANSIVDVNREARSGGYSPAAFITSPTVSFQSGSWSHLQRVASTQSRPEPVQEGRPLDSPLASPPALSSMRRPSQSSLAQSYMPNDGNDFPHQNEHHEEEDAEVSHQYQAEEPEVDRGLQEREAQINQLLQDGEDEYRPSTPPDRPPSSETFRQARTLFHDFDGVHFSPTHEEFVEFDDEGNEARRVPVREIRDHDFSQHQQRTPRARPVSYAEPLPGENMVYYPAPVPRMLNLPKRLSQLPSAIVQAQRRSHVMSQIPQEVRQSTAWLPPLDFQGDADEGQTPTQDTHPELGSSPQKMPRHRSSQMMNTRQSMMDLHNRRSMANLANLPPQLRASVFFEHQPVQQDIRIKSESAVATLDSILAASATAPVSAFTDHPFAGNVDRDVFAREKVMKRNTTGGPLITDAKNALLDQDNDLPRDQKRLTMSSLLGRRKSSGMSVLSRRNSGMSAFTDLGNSDGKKLQKRNSRMSLGSQFTLPIDDAKLPPDDYVVVPGAEHLVEDAARVSLPFEDAEYDEDDDAQRVDPIADGEAGEGPGPFYVQPTTLLAELQLRKAQQKTRNRTAATAFPNGMHSTLLQLDAVAQIEKSKRNAAKVALAWEDQTVQAQGDAEVDEEVPLGVLYATKIPFAAKGRNKGARAGELDWDRPLGLIERRQMEDNEPLSSRRMRLQGINPAEIAHMKALQAQEAREAHAASLAEENNDSDEPLAQRLRRLKQEATLDSALGEVSKDRTFTDDVLSQFGGLGGDDAKAATAEPAADVRPEDETLGQRRARLQREREQGLNPSDPAAAKEESRPNLRFSSSMANLLSAHPMGPTSTARDTREPAPGTLLNSSQRYQTEAKRKLREQNARSTSYNVRPQLPQSQTYNTLPTPGFAGLPTSASMPMGMNGQQNGYFGNMPQMQAGYPQMQTGFSNPQMINPLAYQQFAGQPYGQMATSAGYPMQMNMQMPMAYGQMTPVGMNMGAGMGMGMGYSGMPMPMGYGIQQEAGIETTQRSQIDRWRSSIAQ